MVEKVNSSILGADCGNFHNPVLDGNSQSLIPNFNRFHELASRDVEGSGNGRVQSNLFP